MGKVQKSTAPYVAIVKGYYIEYQSFCRLNWVPHPLPRKRVFPPGPKLGRGGGDALAYGEGVGDLTEPPGQKLRYSDKKMMNKKFDINQILTRFDRGNDGRC
jgi:hypothetical protein